MISKRLLPPCRQGRRLSSSQPGTPESCLEEQTIRSICAALALRISTFRPGGVGRRDSNEMRRALHDAILNDAMYAQMRSAFDDHNLLSPGNF